MIEEKPLTGMIELHTWRDFTKVMEVMGAGKWIYRGHEDVEWKLKSTLDRHVEDMLKVHRDWSKAAFTLNLPRAEFFAISKFREMVRKHQDIDSNAAALIAMQHYGAKTRLLDFTMSIMVALFFAFEKRATGKDRAIYAVNYESLLNKGNIWGGYQTFLAHLTDEQGKSGVDRESERVWWSLGPQIENHFLQRYTMEEASSNIWACTSARIKGIIPLYKAAYNGRQMAQAGIELMPCTFDGFAENLAAALGTSEAAINDPKKLFTMAVSSIPRLESELPTGLVKFVFDHRMEEDAWQILDQANINAATIYPDIEGVAKSVRYNERIILGPIGAKNSPKGRWEDFENAVQQTFPTWDGHDPVRFMNKMKVAGVDFDRLAALSKTWNSTERQSQPERTLPIATDETDIQFLEDVIIHIRQLATIENILIPRDVVSTCTLESTVSSVVEKMVKNCYSHVPVIDMDGKIIGVFSESTMLEMNKAGIRSGESAVMRDVAEFLPLAKHTADVFKFVPKNDAVLHLRRLCDEAIKKRERIGMFFVTENGRDDESLLGILTVWDIAGISDMSTIK